MSDHKGAALILDALPEAKELPADCGYDSDKFRAALIERGITPCIPPRKNRKVQHRYCKTLYTQRHKIKNMFSRLKDWRRIAMRYDRCAHTFLSAINIDATHHILDQSMSPDPRPKQGMKYLLWKARRCPNAA
jgi:transposase